MKQLIAYGIIAILALLTACTSKPTAKLSEIASSISENPKNALMRLDSMHTDTLSEFDRHYHGLLKVKATDKAYIKHTSDTLINASIAYFKHHGADSIYTEALYYKGRVHADLGDAPTALLYFQQALDRLPKDTKLLDLNSRILSQYAYTLIALSLYQEALPIVEESLRINQIRKDTFAVVYDLQNIAEIHHFNNKLSDAKKYYQQSLKLSKRLPASYIAKAKLHLADICRLEGDTLQALNLIRHTPEQVQSVMKSTALAYACNIYLNAGVLDTAYMYAYELVHSKDNYNREVGYDVILSPKLLSFSSKDSIYAYTIAYRKILNEYYKANNNKLALMQESLYNYQLHQRAKDSAEKKYRGLSYIVIAMLSIFTTVLGVSLLLYVRLQKKKNQLENALSVIANLEYKNAKCISNDSNIESGLCHNLSLLDNGKSNDGLKKTIENLRENLINRIISLADSLDKIVVHESILNSDVYSYLQNNLKHSISIEYDHKFWEDLEQAVLAVSPDFIQNLNILSGGKLSSFDIHTALLMKCGMSSSHIATLCGRRVNTISTRRKSICKRLFDEKIRLSDLDKLISLL